MLHFRFSCFWSKRCWRFLVFEKSIIKILTKRRVTQLILTITHTHKAMHFLQFESLASLATQFTQHLLAKQLQYVNPLLHSCAKETRTHKHTWYYTPWDILDTKNIWSPNTLISSVSDLPRSRIDVHIPCIPSWQLRSFFRPGKHQYLAKEQCANFLGKGL